MPDTKASAAQGVEIENLGLSFGATQVLKGVNLSIEPGEFFAFLGPSGSGKSTLLRAIAGFGPEPTGRILIGGEEIARLPPWKRNVGMVFQSYALWPHMSVAKNVAFGLEERKLPKSRIRDRVLAALDLVGLAEFADRRPNQLSGGQQQRVALARTIVIEPRVLLLDEPLSNLDANLRIKMRQDILALQRKLNLTTIFVTHDQEEANTTSDRMAVLDQGVIQQIGSPMELYDRPANIFVAGFLGTANIIRGEISGDGEKAHFKSSQGVNLTLNTNERGERSIMFRPQNASLGAPAPDRDGNEIKLAGSVERKEFLGSIIRYAVNVGGDTLLVDQSHLQNETPLDTGEKVTVHVATDNIAVLAE